MTKKFEQQVVASCTISQHLETIERARFDIQRHLRFVGKEMSKPTEKAFVQILNSLQEQVIDINIESGLFQGE